MGLAGRGVAELGPFGSSKSAQADLEPRASASLSGSHPGPHTQPMRSCSKADCREAVGSFVHALRRRLLIHQPQLCIEVFDDEYEFSLKKRPSALKGWASLWYNPRQLFGHASLPAWPRGAPPLDDVLR